MNKVLILTASPGNGHNSAAKRLKEKLLEKNGNLEICTVDIYKEYASPFKRWTMEDGYFLACNHFLGLYNHFFKKGEKLNFENRYRTGANSQTFPLLNGLAKKIFEFKPDVILCTYIFAAVAACNVKRIYDIPAKIAIMTLDYGVSPYWECISDQTDYMFITNNQMLPLFKQRGFKEENLYITGIPISPKFASNLDKKTACERVGLDANKKIITIMKASFFPIKEKTLVKHLMKLDESYQVVIINGKSDKSRLQIEKYLKYFKLSCTIFNIGFTDKVVEYFSASDLIVGKAGGLTTTETILSGTPSLICEERLPQQEIYNMNFMVDGNMALPYNKTNLSSQMLEIFKDDKKYNEMKENTLKEAKPNSVEDICNILLGCENADYKEYTFTDSKCETIKKIKKALKILDKKARGV